MIQNLITSIIVLFAVGYVLYSIYKRYFSKNKNSSACSGCPSSSNCAIKCDK